jgi:hypothetical protein
MQPHPFSKRQLAAKALLLDEEEKKNTSLSDKKKRMWGSQVFQKQKIRRRILDPVQRIS